MITSKTFHTEDTEETEGFIYSSIVTGFSSTLFNSRRNCAAYAPSMSLWSAERVTRMMPPALIAPFFTTALSRIPPTARIAPWEAGSPP